jgi:hypothetical protein
MSTNTCIQLLCEMTVEFYVFYIIQMCTVYPYLPIDNTRVCVYGCTI